MIEGTSIQDHNIIVINLIIRLGQLSFLMDGELSQDLILQSLSESFSQFIVNYHMNKLNTSLPELLNILKTAESYMKKEKALLLLIDGISKKKTGKKSSKKRLNSKYGIMKRKKGKKASKQGIYFHYGKADHWKGITRPSLQL